MMKEKRLARFQKWIAQGSLIAGACWGIFFSFSFMEESIPDKIWIEKGEEENFDFHLPVTGEMEQKGLEVFGNQSPVVEKDKIKLDLNESFSLKSQEQGSYSITCRLFGLFHIKEVAVEVVEKAQVVPCGVPVGIYVKTDGILIIGTGTVTGSDGMNYEPAENLVKSGDYVKTVDEQVIESKEDLITKINQSQGNPVILGILRGKEYIQLKLQPVQVAEDEYKLGIWVRDDLAGVGTLTFYDEQGNYGALGHPVSDLDTGTKVSMGEGTLYEAEVAGITKGEKGNPGEIAGVITYLEQYRLGTVEENTNVGIYGNLEKTPEKVGAENYFPVGLKQEIEEGEATIISTVSGERKEYSVVITDIDYNSENKGILFQVTDPELLSLTGGIVQGMSGSPIIQNGKVIGAVTHVFVQDASKGYGIFIENMLGH
ncbi:stage IV sporulation protein B [Lachnospiraceae bacterium 3-1]|nr:stage IV sporulation protein B [Lachnospiraceae bacterium 3-1]